MADDDDAAAALMAESSRFAHLLKPIRDLAENWGVDIANDLEEYLGHLNRTAFTIGAGPKLDFAEAALVIQSSACVYSRKVDFLHTLVYQALEAVRTKKRNAEAAAAAADGDGADADDAPPGATQKAAKGRRAAAADAADLEDDTLEGFLSAGLQLPTSNDVDLPAAPPDDDGAPGGQSATFSLTRVPAALLALEDQRGTGNGGGGSSAGGVLGDGDAGCCRLSACTVHVSGALLLDANDADVYDGRLRNRGGRAACGSSGQQHQQQQQQLWLTQHGTQAPGSLQGDGTQGGAAAPGQAPQPGGGDDEDEEGGGGMMAGGASDDDYDGAAPPPVVAAAAAAAGLQPEQQGVLPSNPQAQPALAGAGVAEGAAPMDVEGAGAAAATLPQAGPAAVGQAEDEDEDVLAMGQLGERQAVQQQAQQERVARRRGAAAAAGGDPGAVFDLYRPLEMEGKGSLPLKPMQVKRPSRGAKGAVKPVPAGLRAGAHDADPTALHPRSLPVPPAALRASLAAGLVHPEFAYGLELLHALCPGAAGGGGGGHAAGKAGRAGRAAAAAAAAAVEQRAVFDAADAAAVAEEMRRAIEEEQRLTAAGGAAGAAEGGAAGAEGAAYGDEEDDVGGAFAAGGADEEDYDGAGGAGGGLDVMELVQDVHPGGGALPLGGALHDPYGDEEGAGGDDGSYEELCRAHIEALMAAAAAQEVQTELATRVSGWRSRIDPVLRDEEGRKAFDIQQYQQRIIVHLDGKQQQPAQPVAPAEEVSFGDLASHVEAKWEVSRLFTAMLQLINNRNVALVRAGPPDAPFSLRLLNAELPHKSLGHQLTKQPADGGGKARRAQGGDEDKEEGQDDDAAMDGDQENVPHDANAGTDPEQDEASSGSEEDDDMDDDDDDGRDARKKKKQAKPPGKAKQKAAARAAPKAQKGAAAATARRPAKKLRG